MNATSAPSAPGRGSLSMRVAPRALELGQRGVDIVNPKRDVVEARAALFDELRDRRLGRRRDEQLETRVPDRDEARPHLLARHVLGRLDLQPERVAIEPERGVQVLHRDANVIENSFHTNDCLPRRQEEHENKRK